MNTSNAWKAIWGLKDNLVPRSALTFDSTPPPKGGMLPSNHRRWCTEMMEPASLSRITSGVILR